MRILIRNGEVFDGEDFFASDVLVDKGIIEKIDKHIDTDADFIYDAQGKMVCPGLVDIHVHMKGISPDVFSIDTSSSCLPFGVTSAVDCCGVKGNREILDNFQVKNQVLLKAEIINNKAYFDLADKMLKEYGDKAIGIKIYFDTEVSEVTDEKPLEEVVEYADKHKLKVVVHSSNSPISLKKTFEILRKGDIYTHAFHGGSNSAKANDYSCMVYAKEKGIIIDAGLAGNCHVDFDVYKGAIEKGLIPDVISSDITSRSAYVRGGKFSLLQCMSISEELGMNKDDIFKRVTSLAAKTVNKENEWGYLRVGRCADIAVIEKANIPFELKDKAGNTVKSDMSYECDLCISDGVVVYRKN